MGESIRESNKVLETFVGGKMVRTPNIAMN